MKPLQELRKLKSPQLRLAGMVMGGAIIFQAPAALAVVTPSAIFNPTNITQGSKSQVTITLGNNSITPVTNLAIATITLPAGMRLSTTPVVSNGCNGALTAAPLTNTFSLTGGNIAALTGGMDGECKITLEVIGIGGGNQTLTIPVGSVTGNTASATNTQSANATLQVAGLNKIGTVITFGPTLIPQPGASQMTVRLTNSNGIDLTGVNFASLLPANLRIRGTTVISNTCPVAPTIDPPPTGFKLTGGTIPPGGCEFSWSIEGDLPGGTSQQQFNYSFADGIIETDQFVSNDAGSGSLTIQQGLRVQQSLSRTSAIPETKNEGETLQIFTGETARLTLKLSNAGGALSNLNLNHTLPAGVVIADVANAASTCTGMAITANPGAPTFSFNTGTMPAATATALSECEISVNVTAAAAGTYANNIAVNTIGNTQASNNLNASNINLQVVNITAGGGVGIDTGIEFFGGMNGAFYASNQISAGNEARMRVYLTNNTGIPLSGVGFGAAGVQLPANVRLATVPNPTTTCANGTPSVTGTDTLLLSGATFDRRQSCYVDVSVVSDLVGTYTGNTIANSFVSNENRSNGAAAGNLQVLDQINFEQYFEPTTIAASAAGNRAKMRLRLTNAAAASAGTRLNFRLAGNLKLVGGALSNTCGGTLNLVADSDIFDLTGATIPAAGGAQGLGDDGFCEIEYEVLASGDPVTPSTITNTIPPDSLINAAGQKNSTPISASLNLVPVNVPVNQQVINVTPGDPNNGQPIITGGEPAELRVTLTNQSGIALTNVGYLNNLPANILVYSQPQPNPGNCTGATITAAAEDTKYSVTGISLAPGASCTFNLKVTSLTSDNRDLLIATRDVTSTQGGTNLQPSTVTLTTRGNATVSKQFVPDNVAAGNPTKLLLKVVNANVTPLTNVELQDIFPDGMVIADTPNVTNTCGGNLTAPAGSDKVTLLAGTMVPSSICTISVDVTALTAQPYTNTIPTGSLKTAEGRTNTRDISAVLNVTGTSIVRPGMRFVKRITEIDGTAIAGVFNFTPATGRDDDNAAKWPGPIDAASGISAYLKGAYQGSQVAAQQNNLKAGSTIEYTGYFLSDGTGIARNAVLCDLLPANTEIVPGSASAQLGDGTVIPVQVLAPGAAVPAACQATASNPTAQNVSGAIVVPLNDVTNATAAGAPATAYGNFKFKLKLK
ncbi:MAG: hypothetical protein RLZZ511_1757 [Cyanobacteriota bacterium]|jgi:uncharacterized repeat protein (TIGR01451 family)